MIRQRPFIQCDVFSSVATKGNVLAVVNDADDLSTAQMQSLVQRKCNLSRLGPT